MEYRKTNWIDNETVANSTTMNNIENGIENCANEINEIKDLISKKLWEGNFTSGSINVPELIKYNIIIVILSNGIACFGTKRFGIGGLNQYGGNNTELASYRFDVSDNTLTIDEINTGGSYIGNHVSISTIYGLF